MKAFFFSFFALLCSCGYYFDSGQKIAVSVPYVVNDFDGELTDSLIWALSMTPNFQYVKNDGQWILQVRVIDSDTERIGYRYDRKQESGERLDNLVGIENRKSITVEVTVCNRCSGEVVLGPQFVEAQVDYDYVDQNSLRDLSFIDPQNGKRTTSLAFSLGQLDSVGTAGEDALLPLYRSVALKIVDGLSALQEVCYE